MFRNETDNGHKESYWSSNSKTFYDFSNVKCCLCVLLVDVGICSGFSQKKNIYKPTIFAYLRAKILPQKFIHFSFITLPKRLILHIQDGSLCFFISYFNELVIN